MASYVKRKSNSKVLDEVLVFNKLDKLEEFLLYLRSFHPSEISDQLRSKVFNLYEKYGFILLSWDSYDKKMFSQYKIDKSLWMNDFLLKYVFEDCISYVSNEMGSNDLFCNACDSRIDNNSSSLMEHLNDEAHLSYYKISISQNKNLWKNMDLYKWAFKKYIDLRPDKTLYCKICGISLSFSQPNLISHLEGSKHMQNFKKIVSYKFNFDESPVKERICDKKPEPKKSLTKNGFNDSSGSNFNFSNDRKETIKKKTTDKPTLAESTLTRFSYFDPYIRKDSFDHEHLEKRYDNLGPNEQVSKRTVVNSRISDKINQTKAEEIDHKFPRKTKFDKKSETPSKVINDGNVDKKLRSSSKNVANPSMKDISSHGLFMNICLRKDLNAGKIFCQPCNYFEVDLSVEDIKSHLGSFKHKSYAELKKNLAFMNCQSFTCDVCNIEFFCTDNLISYHKKSKQHKQLAQNFISTTENKTMVKRTGSIESNSMDNSDVLKNITVSEFDELKQQMRILLKLLLKNSSKTTRVRKECGYFCSSCCFWTRKRDKWSLHINAKNHVKNTKFDENAKIFECECHVVIFCDDAFFERHVCSYEHKNLTSFISTKLLMKETSASSDRQKVSSCTEHVTESTEETRKFLKFLFGFQLLGLPSSIGKDDICDVFSKFGEVEFVEFNGSNIADVYIYLRDDSTVSYAEDIIKKKLSIQIKEVICEVQEKCKYKLPEELVSILNGDRSECFKKLVSDSTNESFLAPDGDCISKTNAVLEDFVKTLKKAKEPKIIGSRATGLAWPDSPLDLFIEMDDEYCKTELALILKYIENSLKDDTVSSVFEDVKVEGNHVTTKHTPTDLFCKIFCDSDIVVKNTEAIRFYVQSAKIIKQLILAIKECVKHTDLSQKVSNYAITWMALYFLMQPHMNLLNPVAVLKMEKAEEKNIINGWECTLRKDVQVGDLLKSDLKVFSMRDLLIGFFKYYGSDLDVACVHCPLNGDMVLKKKFIEIEIPKMIIINDEPFPVTNGICLQDPFELNKNLTEFLHGPYLYKFKSMCEEIVTILSEIRFF